MEKHMKIPEKFVVGGFTYKVVFIDKLDCLGQTFADGLEIQLKSDLQPEVLEETFLHEMLHAINHVYCCRSMKETDIRQMSLGLYQVQKDNNIFKEKKKKT
jgi:hypothetical protein